MPRYIDAENIPTKFINFGMPTVICGIEVPDIDSAPTITTDEARGVGEWMPAETELGCACSACGINLDEYVHGGEWVSLTKKPSYCPSCGARMKGAEDETTDNT